MKKYIALTLVLIMSSTYTIYGVPNFIHNPHSNIHKLNNKSINKNTWIGKNTKFTVSCEEYRYWHNDLDAECPNPPPESYTKHKQRNQQVLNIINFYAERMLNVKDYSIVGIIALYNRMAPDLYPDAMSVLDYPWDMRQEGYIGLLKDTVWDWKEIENVLNFRTGLYKIQEDYPEEWRKALNKLLLKEVINVPMWNNYQPYMRQNPILPNNMSERKDFTYSRKTGTKMWEAGDAYSKWYLDDIFNCLIGELDIRYGSKNLNLVDQKYIKRHNLRNVETYIKQISIDDYISNMIYTYEYQNKFNLAVYGEPTLFSDLQNIYEGITRFVNDTTYAKYTDDGFKQFLTNCILPLIEEGNISAKNLYEEMNTLYWWYTYYVTARYII